MAAANFKTYLRQNLEDIKKPKAVPAGSYRGIIKGHELGESAQKKTPQIKFNMVLTEAMEGVDPMDLTEALNGEPLSSKKVSTTFYLTDTALYRLKGFLEDLGIEVGGGRTLEEAIQDTNNAEVLIELLQKPTQSGEDFYNEVGKVTGVE
jgi:hypothetical protein